MAAKRKTTIRALRKAGKIHAAMGKFVAGLSKSKSPRNLIRNHLLGERCLMLDWARWLIDNGQRERFEHAKSDIAQRVTNVLNNEPGTEGIEKLFLARLELLSCVLSTDENSPDKVLLDSAIRQMVAAVADAWGFTKLERVREIESDRLMEPNGSGGSLSAADLLSGPAFLNRLRNDRYRQLFHQIAAATDQGLAIGWTHPGLLMAGETIAFLEDGEPRALHTVKSWIVFAAESDGILARLTVEKRSHGKGLLVPDVRGVGYLQMQETFSAGLQNAWLAIQMKDPGKRSHDYVWRLEVSEAISKSSVGAAWLYPTIFGHSAEVAIAAALWAIDRNEPLDRYSVASARFQQPLESTLKLDRVEGLDVKTRLKVKKVQDWVVSDQQSDIETDTGLPNDPIRVKTFDEAYEQLSRYAVMTREVKKSLARRAEEQLTEFCGPEIPTKREEAEGRRYVPSPIAERAPKEAIDAAGKPLEPRQLKPKALCRFARGKWRPKNVEPKETAGVRLRLFADSGMGKTIQLIACEKSIALDPSPLIPIRIGKASGIKTQHNLISLTDVDWGENNPEHVLQGILQTFLIDHIPTRYCDFAAKWILRLSKLGHLYFLLDALDQTNAQQNGLEPLGAFLNKSQVQTCPALVAGRRESLASQRNLFTKQKWTTLDLLPFEREQQVEFLGSDCSETLVPERIRFLLSSAEKREQQWTDLLATPLLLRMLKDLAVADEQGNTGLGEITNRFQLYGKAVDRMLRKGIQSDNLETDVNTEIKRRKSLFAAIAGQMVGQHNFGILEGADWDQILESLGPELAKSLVQTAMITEYLIIERIETEDLEDDQSKIRRGIDWRHRSFLEYFAAIDLAEKWTDPEQRESVIELLEDIHACLESNGEFRAWKVVDTATGKVESKFRNLPADWRWTLRFFLSATEGKDRNQLAIQLIELGNPWVVWESLLDDKLILDGSSDLETETRTFGPLEMECGLIVKGEWSGKPSRVKHLAVTGIKDAAESHQMSSLSGRVLRLEALLGRETRDSAYLHSIRQFPEGPELLTANYSVALPNRSQAELAEFLQPERWYLVPGTDVEMSDFPVTNSIFEQFCPSHRRARNQYSEGHDQPVVNVSFFEADEFCRWLSQLVGVECRLPTEEEWYNATTWGGIYTDRYWWGDEMRDDLCWYNMTSFGRTRGRGETIATLERVAEDLKGDQNRTPVWHPSRDAMTTAKVAYGLLDLHGNVWEWCSNAYDPEKEADAGSSRVLRGGSWFYGADDCASSYRYLDAPQGRFHFKGFRVCRVV